MLISPTGFVDLISMYTRDIKKMEAKERQFHVPLAGRFSIC